MGSQECCEVKTPQARVGIGVDYCVYVLMGLHSVCAIPKQCQHLHSTASDTIQYHVAILFLYIQLGLRWTGKKVYVQRVCISFGLG